MAAKKKQQRVYTQLSIREVAVLDIYMNKWANRMNVAGLTGFPIGEVQKIINALAADGLLVLTDGQYRVTARAFQSEAAA